MTDTITFKPWPKTPRLFRPITITEKIDGTNSAIIVTDDGRIGAQSRKRLIIPEDDNFGFARWVHDHADTLIDLLGPGYHYGEWWGSKIQRGYGLTNGERRFSLFNVHRYGKAVHESQGLLRLVPILYQGVFDEDEIRAARNRLDLNGSYAEPGFSLPEGIAVHHSQSGQVYKVTLVDDHKAKGEQ